MSSLKKITFGTQWTFQGASSGSSAVLPTPPTGSSGGTYYTGLWAKDTATSLPQLSPSALAADYSPYTDGVHTWLWGERVNLTLNYDANGGTGAPAADNSLYNIDPSSVSGLTWTVSSQQPTRDGYAFAGWNTKADGTGTNYQPGSSVPVPTDSTSMTLYAEWHQVTDYMLTYDANGGSGAPAAQTPTSPDTFWVVSTTTPTRDGYIFAGWNTKADGTGISYAAGDHMPLPIDSTSATLYAQWKTHDDYTLTYDANGGTGAPDAAHPDTGQMYWTVSSTVPTRTGFIFTGWNTKADGSGTAYAAGDHFDVDPTTTDETLYAQWSAADNYTLKYDANGGTGVPADQHPDAGETYWTVSSTVPTRDGYIFTGWNTAADGTGTSYAAGDHFDVVADETSETLYAQWRSSNDYTLNYDANGGTGAPASAHPDTNETYWTVSSTVPTRSGYIFTGWNTAADGSGTTYHAGDHFDVDAATTTETLYAQWRSANDYTLTYDANGGTGAPASAHPDTNQTYWTVSSTVPTRDGYIFTGWNTQADGSGTAYAAGDHFNVDPATTDETLYAQWRSSSDYTLTYDANGGTGAPASAHPDTNKTYWTVSSTVPTRDGYIFTGWNTAADGSGTSYAAGAHFDVDSATTTETLYAQWRSSNDYTLAYDANGGTGAPASAHPDTNETYWTVSSTVPTRDGYIFTGWNTAADGTGTAYAAGDHFDVVADETSETLYAQWRSASDYTLTYDANGGTGAPASAHPDTNETYWTVSSTVPTRDGYIFTGWNTAADGTGTAYAAGDHFDVDPSTTSETLYAQWRSASDYTLTYDANGGTGAPASAHPDTNETYWTVSSTVPTRDGYIFTGWNTQADGSGTAYAAGDHFNVDPATTTETLYAQWRSSNDYTLTYDANGGTGAPASAHPDAGHTYWTVSSTVPTRTGYAFVGWNTQADGSGTDYSAGDTIDVDPDVTDVTLYAKWQSLSAYTLSYDANGGTGAPASAAPDTGESYWTVSSTIPTRDGYIFTGWNTQADGSGTTYHAGDHFDVDPSTTSETLYAQWRSASDYTLTYDANGGTGAPDAAHPDANETYWTVSSTIPTRDGYIFTGWNTAADGSGTAYAAGDHYNVDPATTDETLYAQWRDASDYTLTYDANGGTGAPASAHPDTNQTYWTVSSTIPTRDGYIFTGWNTAADGTGTSYAAGDHFDVVADETSETLYAQWRSANDYTLTYDANGGTGAPTSAHPDTNETYWTVSSTVPTRDGFVFTGWNTKADGTGTAYAAGDHFDVVADQTSETLYAQWRSADDYTLTYDANGGTGAPSSAHPDTNQTYWTVSSTIPTRDGYIFTGWNTAADGSGTSYAAGDHFNVDPATTDETLYAQWRSSNDYTLTYDANGGTGAPASAHPDTNQTYWTVSSTVPTRSGYVFIGWNTQADGSGTAYAAGDHFDVVSDQTSETLYAQWRSVDDYTLTYDANGGTGAPASAAPDDGELYWTVSSTIPTRDGYIFTGWNTVADGSGTSYAAGDHFDVVADQTSETLYAQWRSASDYTLIYDANGGTGAPASAHPDTNQTYWTVSSTIPTRDGYIFTGWNTAADGSGTSYAAGDHFNVDPATTDETLYAQWRSASDYTLTYDANGGTGAPDAAHPDTNQTYWTVSSTIPTRDGYIFTGWNTQADGTGTAYTSGDHFNVDPATTDETLYAQWRSSDDYTLAYDANGGTGAPASAHPDTNQTYWTVSSTVPTRDGYIFTGWNTAADGTGTAYVAGDHFDVVADQTSETLYAQWRDASDYTLTYDANGGAGAPASAHPDTNETYWTVSSTVPTRDGYIFTGWNTQADGTGTTYAAGDHFDVDPATTDETLYAQWRSADDYTLTYDANGGTGAPASAHPDTNQTYWTVSSTIPTRDGYIFTGWNTAADGSGTSYAAGDHFDVDPAITDETLYAQWRSASDYTLTYDANGGTGAPASAHPDTNETYWTVSSTAPTRSGYVFIGWNTQADGSGTAYAAGDHFDVDPATTDETLYAQWRSVDDYTLSYDANGGTGAPASAHPDAGEMYWTVSSTIPTRDGYIFTGWNTKADGTGTDYTSGDHFNIDPDDTTPTLYAKWASLDGYTLTYDANGGENAPDAAHPDSPHTYWVITSDIPTRSGFIFTGWNTEADGSGTTYRANDHLNVDPATTDVILYAQWRDANDYTLSYDANGGTGAPASAHPDEGETYWTIDPTIPTRSGFIFVGWNTEADGTGDTYHAGDTFDVDPDVTDVTLYATWRSANDYTLTYDPNGGTGAPASAHPDPGQTYWTVAAGTPTRDGYTFVGWNTDPDGAGETLGAGDHLDVDPAVTGMTLYAQWRANDNGQSGSGSGTGAGQGQGGQSSQTGNGGPINFVINLVTGGNDTGVNADNGNGDQGMLAQTSDALGANVPGILGAVIALAGGVCVYVRKRSNGKRVHEQK